MSKSQSEFPKKLCRALHSDWAAEQGYCPVIVIRLRDAAHNSHSAPSQRSQLTGQGDVVIHVREA